MSIIETAYRNGESSSTIKQALKEAGYSDTNADAIISGWQGKYDSSTQGETTTNKKGLLQRAGDALVTASDAMSYANEIAKETGLYKKGLIRTYLDVKKALNSSGGGR